MLFSYPVVGTVSCCNLEKRGTKIPVKDGKKREHGDPISIDLSPISTFS